MTETKLVNAMADGVICQVCRELVNPKGVGHPVTCATCLGDNK